MQDGRFRISAGPYTITDTNVLCSGISFKCLKIVHLFYVTFQHACLCPVRIPNRV